MKKENLTQHYISKFIEKHNDKYDYSDTIVESSSKKIFVKCKIHGGFLVTPNNHLNRLSGCPSCKNIDRNFIEEAKLIHNNFYDYSLVNYVNNRTKVKIICPTHGVFEQLPMNHKKGTPCPSCSNDERKYNLDELIAIGNKIFDNKYDYKYLKEDYTNSSKKVRIVCPEHGVFNQSPFSHFIREHGCSLCKPKSNGEANIEAFLTENQMSFVRQKTFDGCVNKTKLLFDFYLPDYNTCIEFNGKQHYEPISIFGGLEQLKKQLHNDSIKVEYCRRHNIDLIVIKYNECINSKLDYLKSCKDIKND